MQWQLNTYLLFVSWVESFLILLLHHLLHSWHHHDNMDKRFFKNWVLHIPCHLRDLLWMVRAWYSIAPIFFFSSYESTESKHFLLAHIPCMDESHDPGRLFKVAINTSAFFTSSFTCFLRSSFDVCYFFQIAWSRNKTSISVSLRKTLVVQVEPWLNQQWSSWPWPSSFGVRLWSSSPSRTGTSLLM